MTIDIKEHVDDLAQKPVVLHQSDYNVNFRIYLNDYY
jgi:hypothetical protein